MMKGRFNENDVNPLSTKENILFGIIAFLQQSLYNKRIL